MKTFSLLVSPVLLALALALTSLAEASVTLGVSPFAKSPSNSGGLGLSLSVDRNESSHTLNWVTIETIGPISSNGSGFSGIADYIVSSALFFPVNESVRLGGRLGMATHSVTQVSQGLGAFALRLYEKDSRFMFEVDLGVSGVGNSYGKAMFGWNLYR